MPTPDTLRQLAAKRDRVAAILTAAMIAIYFGFIALIAYDKPLLGRLLAPGLTLGIVLGVVVIVSAWLLTLVYVRWANRHYDVHIDTMRAEGR